MNKIMDNDKLWKINRQIHGYSPILPPRTGDFMERLYMGESKRQFVAYVRTFGFPNQEVPRRVSFITVTYVIGIARDH